MRHNVYVKIPISDDISYSLFAQGFLIDIPHDDDKESIIFKFQGETVIALFYTFANFRRAYLVTEWQNDNDGEPYYLPGVEVPLYVIYKAKGKKIDKLKHALHILTKVDRYAPFRLPIDFWIKLSNLIEFNNTHKEEVFFLYNKYVKEDKKLK